MPWTVELTVEFHADPPLPADVAQRLLDAAVDAVNEHGYVSNIRVVDRPDLPG